MSEAINNNQTSAAAACSIIIPTRDQLEFLQSCVESVLRSIADQAIEIIIVDNGSTDAATLDYLASLKGDPRFTLIDWHKPFNFSAINNYAAQNARGAVLCFLNNDIEIIDDLWLEKLLPLATRADVGAVGCTLLYPDSTIQHGGIALHAKAIAKHIALREPANFFATHSLAVPLAVDAVTAACMLIRKQLFLQLGGFNTAKLPVAFNDVDLCLRLGEKGLPVLLHPGVQLIHHESVSRKSDDLPSNRARAEKERAYMQFRWQHRLAGQHYKSGIPESVNRQAPSASGSPPLLDDLIAQATANLYLGRSGETDPFADIEDEISNDAENWQKHFMSLRTDFDNLSAHALRVEQAHKLIENSIFWRMTTPLRWLKRKITFEGSRQTTAVNDNTNEERAGEPLPQASAQPVANPDKAGYDQSAKKQFAAFLQSASKLTFPEEQQPALSIILVFYNQAHLSYLCLQSILKHADICYEVIIVDNNSSDDTVNLLAQIENAKVVRNVDNKGFVTAVNQGAQQSRGEFLLILNNDALLEPDALSSAVAVFDEEANVGAVGARIKLLDGSLQEAGSIIWNDGACLGYGRGADPMQAEFQFRREVDYCSGAFLLFRKSVFEELNGFDEAYAPAYYEESDFCIRLQKHGLRVIYNPHSQITHYEFASTGGLQEATKLQLQHRQLLCERHADYLAGKAANALTNVLAARSNNSFPNLLIIDDRVPYPSLGAGYPRAANMLHTLDALDLNIGFYPLLFPEDDWNTVYEYFGSHIEVLLNHGKSGLQKFLEERQGFYQYILVSRSHNMEYFNFIVNMTPDVIRGAKIIYDAEAVTAPRDFLKQEILGIPFTEEEQNTALRNELAQARIADIIVTVSDREAAIFHQLKFDNTLVIGHTISPSPTPRSFAERSGLLFVGALRHDASPNVDSLLWFIINVLPLIKLKIPDIQLHVVGDNSAPSLGTIEVDNVAFHGRMGSIDSLYDACRVFVAPTRFAAGIPHKVHEAAAKGIPSVTTSLLAEQLDWRDEETLLAADAAKDFAEQCVRLYQNEQLWQQLRDNGLTAVTRDCSTSIFKQQLSKLFE